MELAYTQSVKTFDAEYAYPTSGNFLAQLQISEERLPFTVKIVETEEELRKAVFIRQSAYGRHVPEIAEILKEPEALDFDNSSVVLLAESKLDGSPLGSMRIQTNRYEKLKLENSVKLPDWLSKQSQAEAARLGVVGKSIGRLVTTTLFKAFYFYCMDEKIDWMLAVARPVVDKQYQALLFQDVFPERGYIPMPQHANIAHRIMTLNVASVEPSWNAAKHPLYDFFFRTRHPDIIFQSNTRSILNTQKLANVTSSKNHIRATASHEQYA